MSDPTILALDLASRTGWALGNVYDRLPVSGSVRFCPAGSSMGKVFSSCRVWLDRFIQSHPEIDLIVFESPMVPSQMAGRTSNNIIRILIGLTAVVDEYGYHARIDTREAKVSDVRRHFLGSNRIKRVQAKAMTIAACKRLGWSPCDDNAADALALWHYQACVFEPKLSVQTSPLFRRGV